jgi:hypothetical protein
MREEIIQAQKNDEGIAHLRRRLLEGDPKVVCIRKDAEGTLWLKDNLVVQRRKCSRRTFLIKPIRRGTPFILVVPRCTIT